VDRTQDVASLRTSSQTGAGAEGEHLRTLGGRGPSGEQHEPRVRVPATEVANVSERRESIEIEDCHLRVVGLKNHFDASVLYVAGDDQQAGVAVEHRPQAAGQKVLEVSDDEGDGG
jgi:hypothetical protein